MPISYPAILEAVETREYHWSEKDVMLYALAIGMARDPLDPRELRYVYEKELVVMPSFATVAAPRAGARLLLGLDYAKVVDAERSVILHRPLPAKASVVATTRVSRVVDRGAGRGALFTRETRLAEDGEDLATILTTTFARGDGGFGGPPDEAAKPAPHPGPPDLTVEVDTWPNQALLYRLCGDRNPLHADPDAARAAGFERPILHGMCTFGMACRALLLNAAEADDVRTTELHGRFVAPVYPGERLRIDMWRSAATVEFEVRVPARDSLVLQGGRAVLRAEQVRG